MAIVLSDLLTSARRADPSKPLITYYDDRPGHGDRVELSATTTANWVAKTANLLRDECDVNAGDEVGVALPWHWQTVVCLLALWAAGAEVLPADTGTALVCAAESELASVRPGAEVVAFSLAPMNGRLTGTSATAHLGQVLDYAADVLGAGDVFTSYDAPDPDRRALDGLTSEQALAAASGSAGSAGIGTEDRVMVRAPADDLVGTSGLIDGILAPLAMGASIVICRGTTSEVDLDSRGRSELVDRTLTLGSG